MGSWSVRLVSIVLAIILGGGSAAASICKPLCIDDVASTTEVAPVIDMPGHHHHNTSPATEARAQLSTAAIWCVNDCCKLLSRPRMSLAADRLDFGVAPALAQTAITAAVAQDVGGRGSLATRGSPPGDTSAHSRLVLRI